MNWPALISEIQAAGWSQPQIATECQCAQSTISDLAGGKTKDPRYTIGERLKQLAEAAREGRLQKANDDALKLADLARRMAITAPAGQGVAHA